VSHRTRIAALVVVLVPGLVACGGHHSSSGSNSTELLVQHNAQFNDGRTVRWPALPVRVALNGLGTPDEVTAWTSATGGAVTFAFVGGPIGNGVNMRGTGSSEVCGVTTVEYGSDGVITSADIALSRPIYRSPQCVRTVTHETGHAIGFLNHTSNGGLMDDDGGNGQFNAEVTETIQDLYALAPGTFVGRGERPRLGLEPRGRRTLVFVTYPRRR
jgi:hypothetical protein